MKATKVRRLLQAALIAPAVASSACSGSSQNQSVLSTPTHLAQVAATRDVGSSAVGALHVPVLIANERANDPFVQPMGVSDTGAAVVSLYSPQVPVNVAFSSQYGALPLPSGATDSMAVALNAAGAIVGSVTAPKAGESYGPYNRSTVWNAGNAPQFFDSVRFDRTNCAGYKPNCVPASSASAINARGTTVGAQVQNISPYGWTHTHAVRWSNLSSALDLGTLAGDNQSEAVGVNASGVVIGTSRIGIYDLPQVNAVISGVYWTPDAVIHPMGVPRASVFAVQPVSINAGGTIVGTLSEGRGYSFPFTYTNGRWTMLPGLDGTSATNISVTAENDRGDVVGARNGTIVPGASSPAHAIVYDASTGVARDLNTLLPSNSGWILENAYGISNSRIVVGSGSYHGGPDNAAVFTFALGPEPVTP